jgi:hypothetical protein
MNKKKTISLHPLPDRKVSASELFIDECIMKAYLSPAII